MLLRGSLLTLIICSLTLVTALACDGKSDEPPLSTTKPDAPRPAAVTLLLGGTEIVPTPEEPHGGDDCCVIVVDTDELWLILARWQKLSYCVRRNGAWGPVKPIETPGWKYFDRIVAVSDGANHPLIVWLGFDQQTGQALAAMQWTGERWTEPVIVDRRKTSGGAVELRALRQANGRIHVVYDRPLDDREEYNVGGHGAYPSKCFHAIFADGQWSKPQPTTGRGRFDLDPVGLTTGPAGTIWCAVQYSPPYAPGDVAVQSWDGERWSRVERLHAGEGGGVLTDPWGSRLIWWHTVDSVGALLRQDGTETPQSWVYWGATIPVTNDAAGRIAVYFEGSSTEGGRVRVWNGNGWAEVVTGKLPRMTRLTSALNGNLLLTGWTSDGIHLVEIIENPPGQRLLTGGARTESAPHNRDAESRPASDAQHK